jgi:site-specific recombinase XerD
MKVICTSLRSYLRYRAKVGGNTEALLAAIPSPANFKFASVPKTLINDNIRCIINSFDCTTAIGKRNSAIVRCLIDLGLRASEVANISIDDINWRRGTLVIGYIISGGC